MSNPKLISERVDTFGLPLMERRVSTSAEDARYRLEKAKDEVRRALEELRDLQTDYDAKERIGSEIKSAIISCVSVEQSLLTAIQRIENLVHRVRKQDVGEAKVEVPLHSKKQVKAVFEVHGHLERDDQGNPEWVGKKEVKFLGLRDSEGKEFHENLKPAELSRLESQAIELYADEYFSGDHEGK
jgi:hypothetical protein